MACRLLPSVSMTRLSSLSPFARVALTVIALSLIAPACTSGGGKATDAAAPDVAVDATPDNAADLAVDKAPDQAVDKATDLAADQAADQVGEVPPGDVAGDRSPGDTGDGGSGCAACAADELCVADYDGTCHALGTHCLKKTAACPAATCSAACDQYACHRNDAGVVDFTCMTAACPGAPSGAILCHGP